MDELHAHVTPEHAIFTQYSLTNVTDDVLGEFEAR